MKQAMVPPYRRLKRSIVDKIIGGQWKTAQRLPSDQELARQYGVSRLTANKAMCELADEGYVVRAPGLGTFVAENKSHGDLLRVSNIAELIRGRSHQYDNRLIKRRTEKASREIAEKLQIAAGAKVFHTIIVHNDQRVPIQLEDRYVNPNVAPDFMSADLSLTTPTAYLMQISPPHEVEQQVEAVMPTPDVRKLLDMHASEACLLIKRRTWIRGEVVTYVRLCHPGSRYDLSARWKP